MNNRIEMIKFAVSNNSQVAGEALLYLWQNQTPLERRIGISLENNFLGFDAIDDEFLSHCAEVIETGFTLDNKQKARLKRIMPKYANQLARIEMVGVSFPIDGDIIREYKAQPKPTTNVPAIKKVSSLQDLVRR